MPDGGLGRRCPGCAVRALRARRGGQTDRAGRIQVDPDLTLPGHPEISAIGDATKLGGPDGKPLPGLATVAIQQARHVARAIRRASRGHEAVQVLRQGRPGRRRARQGGVRNPGPQALGAARVLHLPDGAPVLPQRWAAGGSRCLRLDLRPVRSPQNQVIDVELPSSERPAAGAGIPTQS